MPQAKQEGKLAEGTPPRSLCTALMEGTPNPLAFPAVLLEKDSGHHMKRPRQPG